MFLIGLKIECKVKYKFLVLQDLFQKNQINSIKLIGDKLLD
jgi:hypothetical protein